MIIARAPLIFADVVLIYITWSKLRSRDALSVKLHRSERLSLQDILFRGGMSSLYVNQCVIAECTPTIDVGTIYFV